jgi:hypothetical protein
MRSLDEILDTARCQRAAALLGLGQFLAEPGHGAVEMTQLKIGDAVDTVVVAPLLAGPVGTGDHQPVQHGEEDGALDRKGELTLGQQAIQDLAASGLAPQALEQQRRTDAHTGQIGHDAVVEQGQDH